MDIPFKTDFQPTNQTLRKWLSTRKTPINFNGIQIPAYFSDTGNSADSNWFWIAVLGEVTGIIMTVYGGFSNGGVFIWLAMIGILAFVFCDFFFAVLLHRKKGVECELKSRRFILGDSNKTEIVKIQKELEKGKILDFFLEVGIIVIGLFKTLAIVLLGVFNSITLYIPFLIIYLIVSYIHLKHTGYFFAYLSTEKGIHDDFEKFADGENLAKKSIHPISFKALLNGYMKHGSHEIEFYKEENGVFKYNININGVLTDEDIIFLLNSQNQSDKLILFKEMRNIQLSNFLS
jgi:hypothetical protein